MKIQQSSIALQSQHVRSVSVAARERLELWAGSRSGREGLQVAAAATASVLESTAVSVGQSAGAGRATAVRSDAASEVDPRMQTLLRMIEAITGMPVRLFGVEDLQPSDPGVDASRESIPDSAAPSTSAGGAASPAGWGLVYEQSRMRAEAEQLSIQAQGQIQTSDGRTIAFDLGIELSASRVVSSQTTVRAGDAVLKDPLVLHFDGPVGALRDARFQFDLDADGRTEAMPFVGQGSGFLVLDRNGNGKVDDGSELFGARSGDGFADLAQLDDDRNGWIDEADAVFQRLQVWRMDDTGKTQLSSLASADVGALYLGRVASEMQLQASPNAATLGQLRSTGLYLRQSGIAGLMQQVDLVV